MQVLLAGSGFACDDADRDDKDDVVDGDAGSGEVRSYGHVKQARSPAGTSFSVSLACYANVSRANPRPQEPCTQAVKAQNQPRRPAHVAG